jgi:hypothetical protein
VTARVGDDMPQTREALRASVAQLRELLAESEARARDLEDQLAGARRSVSEQQKADAQHRLVCRVKQRPTVRRTGDVPAQNLT